MNKTQCYGCGELIFAYNAIERTLCPDCEEFFDAAPEKIAQLRAENDRLRAALDSAVKTLRHVDNMTLICPVCGRMNGHSEKCDIAKSLAAGYEILEGGAE